MGATTIPTGSAECRSNQAFAPVRQDRAPTSEAVRKQRPSSCCLMSLLATPFPASQRTIARQDPLAARVSSLMRPFLLLSSFLILISSLSAKPNVIYLMDDELGYFEPAFMGGTNIQTPNLDRMADEGLRFTDFYSAAEVCTPSRAALLTGR